ARNRCRVRGQFPDILVARGMFENQDVFADWRACQPLLIWCSGKGGLQSADGSKIKVGVAPLQQANWLEAVTFQSLHELRIKRIASPGCAKCAVPGRATGTTGDLRKFCRIKLPELVAVEFSVGSEGYVIDIEIEPHPDGIGRDQIVDIARLVQSNLRIAGPRRKRAQHYRGTPALPADQFSDRVNFLRGESDDR